MEKIQTFMTNRLWYENEITDADFYNEDPAFYHAALNWQIPEPSLLMNVGFVSNFTRYRRLANQIAEYLSTLGSIEGELDHQTKELKKNLSKESSYDFFMNYRLITVLLYSQLSLFKTTLDLLVIVAIYLAEDHPHSKYFAKSEDWEKILTENRKERLPDWCDLKSLKQRVDLLESSGLIQLASLLTQINGFSGINNIISQRNTLIHDTGNIELVTTPSPEFSPDVLTNMEEIYFDDLNNRRNLVEEASEATVKIALKNSQIIRSVIPKIQETGTCTNSILGLLSNEIQIAKQDLVETNIISPPYIISGPWRKNIWGHHGSLEYQFRILDFDKLTGKDIKLAFFVEKITDICDAKKSIIEIYQSAGDRVKMDDLKVCCDFRKI